MPILTSVSYYHIFPGILKSGKQGVMRKQAHFGFGVFVCVFCFVWFCFVWFYLVLFCFYQPLVVANHFVETGWKKKGLEV